MDTEVKKKSIIDRVWDVFASVKLAVVLFALISLTSVVGTVLEQQAEPEKNIEVLSKMFGLSHDAAHSVLQVFEGLGFTNMYHSWWFNAFLLLFAANLIICSLDRLPRIWKLVTEKVRPLPVENIGKMSIRRELALKGTSSAARDAVLGAIRKLGFKPSESTGGNGTQWYAEKGNYTRLGVYITHLSILIILVGAMIGTFFGFNGSLRLREGQTSYIAVAPAGRLTNQQYAEMDAIIQGINKHQGSVSQAAASFGVQESVLAAKMKEYGILPLGFGIRCDNFNVDYYDRTDMPKAYRSWLTVFKDGRPVINQKSIVVNDPLKFEGVTFYQSSFETAADDMSSGVAILRVAGKSGQAQELHLKAGESFTIPGTAIRGQVQNFSPAISLDESGKPFTYNQQMTNPAVFIEFTENGARKYGGWFLKRYPQTWNLPDGNRVEFLDYWGVEFTGLQVRKDPGVLIVYLGCIIMAVGLYITFFMSHRRIWVNVADGKGGAKVLIGASANRNRASFERRIEKMISMLSAGHQGGK
ncbi:MAG: cytochrome c biogenesis protein ResB [Thermodesulfovibrionales bacterium]